MVKNHVLFKRIAIGVLIAAPFVAQIASRQTPAPTEQAEPETTNTVETAPPAPPPAMVENSTLVPAQQPAFDPSAPFDPKPTLDPSAIANAMSPQSPATPPLPDSQIPAVPPLSSPHGDRSSSPPAATPG